MNLNAFHKITKPINWLLPKKNAIYAVPSANCRKDHYDLINYSSDNLLCVIRFLYENYCQINITIYLECFSESRMPIVEEYIHTNKRGRMTIIPVQSHITEEHPDFSITRAIRNTLLRFRCKIWLADTGHVNFYEKVNRQKFFVMNYCTPFKAERGIDAKHNFLNIDGYVHTSQLCAHYLSAEYMANYYNSLILGFPRNDTLFSERNKNQIEKWIENKTGIKPEKVIVYAPTYRDYTGAYNKGVLGFEDSNGFLESFLDNTNSIIVVKMHPRQEISKEFYSRRIIEYETSYNFSLYDLMAYSDLLISDYSSLIHDYIITGKKVVLNWFDEEKYDDTRGFAFEPIESICPGNIARSLQELIDEINSAFQSETVSEKQLRVASEFHKYRDHFSTERVCNYLMKQFEDSFRKR